MVEIDQSTRPPQTVPYHGYCAFYVLVQTNFRRYFYFLPDQSQILLDHFNILDELWSEISTGFDIRWRISPIEPNDRGEFELDMARSNNNAENSFALGHETDKVQLFSRLLTSQTCLRCRLQRDGAWLLKCDRRSASTNWTVRKQ